MPPGGFELLIILAIIMLLFGASSELGRFPSWADL